MLTLDGNASEIEDLDIEAIEGTWSSDGTDLYLVRSDDPSTLIAHDLSTGEEREVLGIGTGIICGPVARVVAPDAIGRPPEPAPQPMPFERALLEPGRYRIDAFDPAMEAEFGAGWQFGAGWLGRVNLVDGWQVSHVSDLDPTLTVSRVLVGLSGPCETDEEVVIGSQPEDVVRWLESRDDLEVTSRRQVTVGGRAGIRVEIVPVPGTACSYTGDWNIYLPADDIVWLAEDEMLEWTVIDDGNATVVFQKHGPRDRMAAFDELADPVLESVRFSDA
jgi:hypothetical protein